MNLSYQEAAAQGAAYQNRAVLPKAAEPMSEVVRELSAVQSGLEVLLDMINGLGTRLHPVSAEAPKNDSESASVHPACYSDMGGELQKLAMRISNAQSRVAEITSCLCI